MDKLVCVVTGGTGGIGSAAVREMLASGYKVLFADVNAERNEAFKQELIAEGYTDVECMTCDVSDRVQCDALAAKAKSMGKVQGLIHLAGLTPAFASYDAIVRVEAIGTLNMNEAFYQVMEEGSSIMNISSQTAHMVPFDKYPTEIFDKAFTDRQAFYTELCHFCKDLGDKMGGGQMPSNMAYTYSRCFIYWLCRNCCYALGRRKGIKINTVSIGFCETPRSKADLEAGGLDYKVRLAKMVETTAFGRPGYPEEVAKVFEFLINPKNSYLSGIDILWDNGQMANGHKGRGGFDPATRPYDPEKKFDVDYSKNY